MLVRGPLERKGRETALGWGRSGTLGQDPQSFKAKALDSVVPTCVPGQVATFGSFHPHLIQDQDTSRLCSVAGSQGLCSGPESPTMLPAGQQGGSG